MTDQRTAREVLADGYGTPEDYAGKRDRRRAGVHRPDHDAEADRLTSTIGDALPTQTRIALGYHASAREAAHKLNDQED